MAPRMPSLGGGDVCAALDATKASRLAASARPVASCRGLFRITRMTVLLGRRRPFGASRRWLDRAEGIGPAERSLLGQRPIEICPECLTARGTLGTVRVMKFGLYSSIANPPRGEHLDRCIDEVIAEAQLAEANGFDSCFFGEHHQDHDGFLPSPLIVATAVAARTTRLRVGTSVILLPLHHPVHVAEDAITLDLVSKGRLLLGVGIGYQPAGFRAFSVPMEERAGPFEESIEILRRCWAGAPFSFRAKHYSLDDVQILPRPYHKSGPPLWIGARIAAAARRAGRIAAGFVGTPSTGMANAVPLADVYKDAARAAGRPAEVVQMRDAWVAATRAEADAVYGPHVMTAYRYYWEHRLAEFSNMPADTQFTLENLAPDRLILGDPETCVGEFQRWHKATGASTFLLRLRHAHSGGPPHEKIMEAIRLFGERVLPYC